MYAVAARLDPDSYFALARATYREMAAAGITAWGSSTTCTTSPTARRTTTPTRWGTRWSRRPARPGSGSRCSTPATSARVRRARSRACRCRYADGDADAWAERVDEPASSAAERRRRGRRRDPLGPGGARATSSATVVAGRRRAAAARPPLRAGRRERACLAAYGVTPTQLLADAGVLGPLTTAVHATHLTDDDVAAARGERDPRLLLPDHRARPRRRHRPQPARCTTPAARSRWAATATR